MELSALQLALATTLVAVGSWVQSAIGFGLAVLAAPLLYLVHPALIPGPVLALALILSALNLWSNRTGMALGELTSAFIGRMPGMVLALWVLTFITQQALSLILGATVLAAVALSLTSVRMAPTPKRLFVAGFFSGFMGTSTSIGGPPMALVYQYAAAERMRANLAGYFLLASITSIAGLALIGRFGTAELVLTAALTPPALAGFIAARWMLRRFDPHTLRPAVLTLCALSGLLVLADGLLGG